ncbi:MAG: restriction endonuclease subunit S [Candidatus Competibacteraceae bacterium]|nr:restriction endonuclease subunit S [Candidatus Competibacteraceae bacterium]
MFVPSNSHHDFVEKVIAKCTGSSYPAINSSDLAEISVAIPKPIEQHKIADCLASLDELITAQAQKLATLKTHKKGLMQQLFPAEGETMPKPGKTWVNNHAHVLKFERRCVQKIVEDYLNSISLEDYLTVSVSAQAKSCDARHYSRTYSTG